MHQHTQQLCDALDQLNVPPTWHEASRLDVELVDHDSTATASFHLANGDVVHSTQDGWAVNEQGRSGRQVRSGELTRVHNPGIDSTARVHATAHIDPTARVEAGAVIGPRVYVSSDAHVGRDTHVGSASFVGSGAFIGTGTTVRGGCHIGDGAVIGAGSDLGSCTRVSPGTQLAHGSMLDNAESTPRQAANSARVAGSRSFDPWVANQIATTVERLSAMNRD